MKPAVAMQQGARFLPDGLVSGEFLELGYFSISEIEAVRGSLGLPVERDLNYSAKSLEELKRLHSHGGTG